MPDALKQEHHTLAPTLKTARASHATVTEIDHADPYPAASSGHDVVQRPTTGDAAIARLRVRMEALEHLVIILLADTESRGAEAVRGLLNDIPFWTDPGHNVESRCAAAHMIRLVERSDRLRSGTATD